jgi:hypothetical protein
MTAVAYEASMAQYDLAFQISPIILQGGIAAGVQGGLLPITSLTGGAPANVNAAFARYIPVPGSTLISQSVPTFPLANQAVAANSTIQEPLTLSMLMIAPVYLPGGMLTKLQTFSALQQALARHNNSGGLYIVATPANVYTNLLMLLMTDATNEESEQKQIIYQIDFVQPIITLAGAAAVQSTLMQKITAGQVFTFPPSWSGNQAASPASLTNVTGALSAFGGAIQTTTGTSGASTLPPGII